MHLADLCLLLTDHQCAGDNITHSITHNITQ
jgi:hypothetical protein